MAIARRILLVACAAPEHDMALKPREGNCVPLDLSAASVTDFSMRPSLKARMVYLL